MLGVIKLPNRYRRNDPTVEQDVMSVRFGLHLLNRVHDIRRKRGFITASEFIRYAVRKELDLQAQLKYMPDTKVSIMEDSYD